MHNAYRNLMEQQCLSENAIKKFHNALAHHETPVQLFRQIPILVYILFLIAIIIVVVKFIL